MSFKVPVGLKPSFVAVGNGVFAENNIPKDTLVYEYVYNKDIHTILDDAEYASLLSGDWSGDLAKKFREYGYRDFDGDYVLTEDSSRYIRHGDNPNLVTKDNNLYALRDIRKGEELFEDYFATCDTTWVLQELESYIRNIFAGEACT